MITGRQIRAGAGLILPKGLGFARRFGRRIGFGLAGFVAAVLVANWALPPPLEKGQALSAMVTDQNGVPLRAFPTVRGGGAFRRGLKRLTLFSLKPFCR